MSDMRTNSRSTQQDITDFGKDSPIFRKWADIHPDFRCTDAAGNRQVMVNGGGRGSLLTLWRGPAALTQ